MANLETLKVTVDASISPYKKKMEEVKAVTRASMEKVENDLKKAEMPAPDTAAAESLEKVSAAVDKVKEKLNSATADGLGRGLDQVGEAAENSSQKVGKMAQAMQAVKLTVKEVAKAHPALAGFLKAVTAATAAGKKGFTLMAKAVHAANTAIKKVSGAAHAIIQKFNSAASAAKRVASAILGIGRSSETAARRTNLLGSALGKIASFVAIGAIINFGKSCIDLGSDLAEVQNVVDNVFPHMKNTLGQWARDAASQFGLSETMAKRYAGTFGAMAKSFGFVESEAYEMSTKLAGLSGDIASFYNISQDEAYTKVKSVFTGETESLKELGVVMTQSALDQFALQNGLGKTTQAMTEQEKVALRYAFVQKQLATASNDFVRTSDSWANQVRLLSLNFQSLKAVIGEGLINAFTPLIKVLNLLLGKIATVANAFRALTAMIFGKAGGSNAQISTAGDDLANGYDSAADSANNLADATSNAGNAAADAAKKALGLMAFDKINKLSDDSSKSGGSGGSGGGGGAGGLGEAVDFGTFDDMEETADSLSGKLKGIFDVLQQSWENKGERVINAWSSAMGSIKTLAGDIGNSFYEVFTNGTGTAFLDNVLEIVGDIGDAIDTVTTSMDKAWNDNDSGTTYIQSVFDKFNAILVCIDDIADSAVRVWGNGTGESIFGHALAILTNMNNAVANIATNFSKAWTEGGRGDSIMQDLANIIDTCFRHAENLSKIFENFTKDIDFGPLLESFDNLLKAIDKLADVAGKKLENFAEKYLAPIGKFTIEEGAPKAINLLADALDRLANGDFLGVGRDIGMGLGSINTALAEFTGKESTVKAVNSMAEDLADLINGTFDTINLADAGKAVGNALKLALNGVTKFIKEVDWAGIGKQIGEFFANIDWPGVLASATKLMITALFSIADLGNGIITGFVGGLATKLQDGIKNSTALNNLGDWIGNKAEAIKITVTAHTDKLFDDAKKTWDSFKNSDAVKTVKANIEGKWEDAKTYWKSIKSGSYECLKKVKTKISGKWEDAKTNWKAIKSGSYTCLKTVKAVVEKGWSAAQTTWKSIVSGSYTAKKIVKASIEGAWTTAKNNWKAIKEGVSTATKVISLKFNSMIDNVRGWLQSHVADPLNRKMWAIPIIGEKWNGLYFANGAYLPANNPVLAMVGDNRNHPEIVAPEPKMREMADRAAENAGSKLDYQMLQKVIEFAVYAATMSAKRAGSDDNKTTVVLEGDMKKLFRAFVAEVKTYYRVHGTLPWPT